MKVLSKKFKNRTNIEFTWRAGTLQYPNSVKSLPSAEKVSESGGVATYSFAAKDYSHAKAVDNILARDGRPYEVRA